MLMALFHLHEIRILDRSIENRYQTRPLEFFFRTIRIYIESNIQAELSPCFVIFFFFFHFNF